MKKLLNKYIFIFAIALLFSPLHNIFANASVGSVSALEYINDETINLLASTNQTSYVETLEGEEVNATVSVYSNGTFTGQNDNSFTSAKITGILSTANNPDNSEIANAVAIKEIDFGEVPYVSTSPNIFSQKIKIPSGVNVYYLYIKVVLNKFDYISGDILETKEINTALKIIVVPNPVLVMETDATPKNVQPGQETKLTWRSIGSTRCFCNYPKENIRSSKLYKLNLLPNDEKRAYDQDQSSPLIFVRREFENIKRELDWGNYDQSEGNIIHVPEQGMVDCYGLNKLQEEDFDYTDERNLVNGGIPMPANGSLYIPMSQTGDIQLSCSSFSDLGYPTDEIIWENYIDDTYDEDYFVEDFGYDFFDQHPNFEREPIIETGELYYGGTDDGNNTFGDQTYSIGDSVSAGFSTQDWENYDENGDGSSNDSDYDFYE
jgi:hypothetical protein